MSRPCSSPSFPVSSCTRPPRITSRCSPPSSPSSPGSPSLVVPTSSRRGRTSSRSAPRSVRRRSSARSLRRSASSSSWCGAASAGDGHRRRRRRRGRRRGRTGAVERPQRPGDGRDLVLVSTNTGDNLCIGHTPFAWAYHGLEETCWQGFDDVPADRLEVERNGESTDAPLPSPRPPAPRGRAPVPEGVLPRRARPRGRPRRGVLRRRAVPPAGGAHWPPGRRRRVLVRRRRASAAGAWIAVAPPRLPSRVLIGFVAVLLGFPAPLLRRRPLPRAGGAAPRPPRRHRPRPPVRAVARPQRTRPALVSGV